MKLPGDDIVVVHRSDGSGTTYIWTDYLSKVSPEWKTEGGQGNLGELAGGLGRQGQRRRVRRWSSRRRARIGYVELIYAIQNNMPYGKVKNSSGAFVKADLAGVSAAAAAAAKFMPDDFRVSITNPEGKAAYPISSFTWLLIPGEVQRCRPSATREGLPEVDDDRRAAILRRPGLREAAQGSRRQGNESDRADSVNVCNRGSANRTKWPPHRTRQRPRSLTATPRSLLRRLDAAADEIAHLITLIAAATLLLITVLLVYQLWVHSAESRAKFGWSFFVTQTWDPVSGDFGALPFIYGTLVTSALALFIAVPLGVGAAIFLAELAPPKLSSSLTFVIDLLAAVPSVIYGLLGVFLLVPIMRTTIQPALKKTLGISAAVSGAGVRHRLSDGGHRAGHHDRAVYHLGVARSAAGGARAISARRRWRWARRKWEATWKVVVPAARTGIFGSVFLALARALGETMAVTMVIGNNPKIAASLFSPGYSIAAVLANEFSEATGNLYLSALIELGLVLFLLTFVLNGLARLLILVTTARGSGVLPDMSVRLVWRKSLNVVMLSLTGLCALSPFRPCFLFSAIWSGTAAKICHWSFFTQLPAPVGEAGGGMANAIVGSLKLLLLAALIGVPIGLAGRRVPGGIWRADRAVPGALYGGPAERRAVDRHRHFRLRPGGDADASLFDSGRRIRAGHHDDSHGAAQHGEFLARCAALAARGRHGAGREQMANDRDRRAAGRLARHSDRRSAGAGARGGRNGAAAVHRVRQPLLEPRLEAADVLAAGYDLHLCDGSV